MPYNANYPSDAILVKELPKAIREKGESLKELIDSKFDSYMTEENQPWEGE